jgi:hypothetical protein
MPAFAYTSGNISNLTAGGAANMADLQGPLTDVRAALNGNLDEVNVPNLAAAFTTYKRLQRAYTQITQPAAGTYLLQAGGTMAANQVPGVGASVGLHVIYLDPTAYNANARTTKLQLRSVVIPNAVAPAVTFTAGLYPIATFGGASGLGPVIATLGTVVTGSTAPVVSPSAAALTTATSGDLYFPAAGGYVLAVATSGVPAANSVTELSVNLEMRQV